MPGPPPKDPKLRQRQNKTSTAAKLIDDSPLTEVPELGDRRPDRKAWRASTVERWRIVWESPMAGEYLASDVPGLRDLAVLWDEFTRTPTARLAGEIRSQEQRFGLSPIDRRRLQWEIERVDEAQSRRRQKAEPAARRSKDPRDGLRVMKGGAAG